MVQRLIPRLLGKAGKDYTWCFPYFCIYSNLGSTFDPIVQVTNCGWGENTNLTFSVLSPTIVNESGVYCHWWKWSASFCALPSNLTAVLFDDSFLWDFDSSGDILRSREFSKVSLDSENMDDDSSCASGWNY